ncbi:DUF4225 domain-containing protein [Yersinia bercovieri]|uniref:DUF4225 domain-containing protein n=1 Tax=Yersinia bercovieri TaxID=634 RepID=UPI001CFDD6FD|nr:DUF4225 domain-containing protein [Yersinia bercovieri]MCB5301720.1 DUF4225 domain-containing protein [Yersinia bercovieri]
MDATLLSRMRSGGRITSWSETMVNLEAHKLINIANTLSASHLSDSLTRINFIQEIKEVVEQQFAAARRATSDEECMVCIQSLRAETENLQAQDQMLRLKTAKLYAKVEFVRENNKIVGYIITAVNVVLSGLSMVGGAVFFASMTPLGMLAGATLFLDGVNGLTKEVNHHFFGKKDSEGMLADGAMNAAEFMGFKKETGLAVYNSASLGANVYGIFGLLRKSGSWRLFHYLPQDYYRKVDMMSRPKLTMKIVGYGLKAKVIFDLLSTDEAVR